MFTHLLEDMMKKAKAVVMNLEQQRFDNGSPKEEAASLFCAGFYTDKLLSYVVT